ncbi:M50 family metallopeptidase [Solicola sp. PLA-1-18]|uniref:M50 family metallopeptidase n=1 Tax=Solicola sp. PLA-1-18 TaxID=3380532 RepID=UPI003B7B7DE0
MTVLLYTLGVLAVAVGIVVSIALHEVGHMYPAKKFGVKVTQYFVGFGKTVWSVRRGETEYGFKAFPLGGFVKLVGMLPPEPGEDETHVRKSNTGLFTQLIADARSAEYEDVRPEDAPRMFYRLPWWKKLIVMAGGPMVNVVIAFVLFLLMFATIGAITPTTQVNAVSRCVIADTEAGRACKASDPAAPAAAAGLRAGDTITAFDGRQVSSWPQLTQLIRDNGSNTVPITYERDGQSITRDVSTQVIPRQAMSASGEIDPDRIEDVGFLGVEPTQVYVRHGVGYTLDQMGSVTVATGEAILHLPQRMVDVAKAAVGGEREANSPISVVGAGRIAGEVASDDQAAVKEKVAFVISLLASLNLFLALFNFIPLLPLDGGHIVGALWEGVKRAFAKVFKRPEPRPVDVGKALPVAYAVGAVLLVMGVLLIYVDIVNPLRLT